MGLSPHLASFIHLNLTLVRLFHFASILFWILLWAQEAYRLIGWASVYSCSSKTEESKCMDDRASSHSNLELNQPNAWQTSLYALGFLIVIPYLFFTFGLRYDECSQLLTLNAHFG